MKLHNELLNDFIAALELLNSPELVWKVKLNNHYRIFYFSMKDLFEYEMKPLIESVDVSNRDETAIKGVWKSMYLQLLETRSSHVDTPSIQKGSKQKDFAQVCICTLVVLHCLCMLNYPVAL